MAKAKLRKGLCCRMRRGEPRTPKMFHGNPKVFEALLAGHIDEWDERHDPLDERELRWWRRQRDAERFHWLDSPST